MKIRVLIILFLFSVNIYSRDTTVTANDWFAEIRLADSKGWTLDVRQEADISIGRRMFKNIFFRMNGGFNSVKTYNNIFLVNIINNENNLILHRYSGGVDVLYAIEISRKLTFKTGIGFEYFYSKKNLSVADPPYLSDHERKDFASHYKLIQSFNYSFTKNIYAYIQFHIAYERHHGTQKDHEVYEDKEFFDQFDYKERNIILNNFILGGGISF
jgi:hypothetical protein